MKKFFGNSVSGVFLGLALCLAACRPTYEVTRVEGYRVAMDSTLTADAAMDALVAPYKAGVDSVMQRVVGTSAVSMEAERPESLLSNLVADVLRDAAAPATGKAADMGLVNMGGLRNVITKGPVTCEHIFEILPFENSLCVLTLKGETLKQLFENIAARGGEGVSGVKLTISADGRLLDATIGGRPVEDGRMYTVATIDYLAEGNDGMTALIQAEHRECPAGATLRNLFMQYVEQQTAAGKPLTARLEGRIVVK